MVIDADPDARAFLRSVLESAGMRVSDATTGEAGLTAARGLPDVVICDVRLTDMSGHEVAAALKSDPLTQQVAVIQRSSGDDDETAQVDGLSAGADAYVVDPVRADVLLATVESLLRQRELSQQLELALSLDVTGVYDWNVERGVVRWSESLERIHGLEPGGFGGTLDDFLATVHDDDREQVVDALDTALAQGDSVEVAFRFVSADGSHGWMEGRGRVFRNADGEPTRVLGLAHDVTQRVRERHRLDQLRRLASALNAARTTNAVLTVLRTELADTNVEFALVDEDDSMAEDVTFSYVVGRRRLDLSVGPGDAADVSDRQAVAIGELAGGALDRAMRYEAERSNAAALQRALLSTRTPTIDGWIVDAAYEPASEEARLGGDFYDVIELDGCFVVVIGDVAGHGLAATRLMGMVRTLMRTMAAMHDGDPAVVLAQARALFDDVCGAQSPFVTVLVARVDAATGTVAISSAGHPPPIVSTADRRWMLDLSPDPPLGVESSGSRPPTVLTLEGGEWLGFYTDGVFETRTTSLDSAVDEAVGRLGAEPSAADLIDAGEAHAALNLDDRAALVVRRRPTSVTT